MAQNVTTMDNTIDDVIINAASTMNTLERLVTERRWESVLAHLKTIQGRDDARKRNSTTGELLYHNFEFYKYAPFRVIKALVKAYPEGILEPMYCSWGEICYPIETILTKIEMEQCSILVLKLFVETNPKCLDNCNVRFFLNALWDCDTEVLELMIQTNPNFLYQKEKDSSNGLPIHIACSRDMDDNIDVLLAADPLQARMALEDLTMLPLHLACRPFAIDYPFNMETFRQLIEAYPQATKEKDSEGRLPLHYACGGASYRPDNEDFVRELLKIYPEAAQRLDKRKNLPLHYLFMPEQSVQCDYFGHKMDWLECEAVSVNNFLQGNDHRRIEKELILLIQTYPDALLQSDGEQDRLVLERLADLQYPSRQVWHTAGIWCLNAFICASMQSMPPLYHMSLDLPALVQNFLEIPLDWTKNEGDMQVGELVGIILYYTFEALLQATVSNHVPLCHHLVMHYTSFNNKNVTGNTTLLHKLAYCSRFCDPSHLIKALELHVSKQGHPFLLADQNGNLPLHLVCCAPPPLILSEVQNRRMRETTYVGLVKTFLTLCMEAASKTNHLGKTPLDILMETKSELSEFNIESWGGVELLVTANPTEANKLFTKENMYLFMIAAIGEQANLSFTFSMLLSFVLVQNLDDLGSTTIVTKIKKQKVSIL